MAPMAMVLTWIGRAGPIEGAIASAFARLAAGVAPVAVAALWQGLVIALVLDLSLHFASRIHLYLGAAQRFALWAATFAVIAGLPLMPLLTRGAAFTAAHAALGASPDGQGFPPPIAIIPRFQVDARWTLAIAGLWLMASLVRAANLAVHSLRLRRLWRSATPVVANQDLRSLLAAASTTRRTIELCITRELDRPSVIGFLAPRILIPDWLFARLTPVELEHVVLHEAEHLRRGDDWTNLLQKLALVLFPLNPALAWIERRLCREREMACDEGVVRRTQSPRAYAASLANLAGHALDRRRVYALSLGAFERRPELARRVSSLLTRKQALHPVAARALVGVAACGLLGASVDLARCPRMVTFVSAAPAATGQNQMAQLDMPTPQREGDRVDAQPIAASNISSWRALPARAILHPAGEDSLHGSRESAGSEAKVSRAMNTWAEAIASEPGGHSPSLSAVSLARAGNSLGPHASSNPVSEEQLRSTANRQQIVVFTAWEEIETSPRHAARIADYDASGTVQVNSSDSESASENPASQRPSLQITVTRLIFLLPQRPVGGASNTAIPASELTRPRASGLRLYSAPLPESGWLVFEL